MNCNNLPYGFSFQHSRNAIAKKLTLYNFHARLLVLSSYFMFLFKNADTVGKYRGLETVQVN